MASSGAGGCPRRKWGGVSFLRLGGLHSARASIGDLLCPTSSFWIQTGFTDDVVSGPVQDRLISGAGPETDFCLFLEALCCFWLEEVYTKAAPTDAVIQGSFQ